MFKAIRGVDRRKLVWYEPQVIFNYGSNTNLPPLGDRGLGFAFHDYCLEHDEFHTKISCANFGDLPVNDALAHSTSSGLRRATQLFEPPKPNELDSVMRTEVLRGAPTTRLRLQSGSGSR